MQGFHQIFLAYGQNSQYHYLLILDGYLKQPTPPIKWLFSQVILHSENQFIDDVDKFLKFSSLNSSTIGTCGGLASLFDRCKHQQFSSSQPIFLRCSHCGCLFFCFSTCFPVNLSAPVYLVFNLYVDISRSCLTRLLFLPQLFLATKMSQCCRVHQF